jgi:prepilin signal peptidase PulO-like enzyme (type II secretory pathway)
VFGLWLLLLTGLMALLVYDARWKLLPDRLMYPLGVLASLLVLIQVVTANRPAIALVNTLLAVAVGGGIFYFLFQVSKGKWIGGGDVKLGWLLGLVIATPARATLMLFIASLLGTIISLPLLVAKRLKRNSTIPFGPFLILAAIIVQLFGHTILHWYARTFLTLG